MITERLHYDYSTMAVHSQGFTIQLQCDYSIVTLRLQNGHSTTKVRMQHDNSTVAVRPQYNYNTKTVNYGISASSQYNCSVITV